MADTIGEFVYKIVGDNAELKSAVSESKSIVSEAGAKIKEVFGEIAVAMGLAIGIEKLVELGKEMTNAASIAEQTANRFAHTFPDALGAASESVENLIQKYNYSDDAAQGVMASVGSMAQQMGITQKASVEYAESMAGLGADLSSYYGVSEKAEEVTKAIQAAVRGQTREVKQYGLALDDVHLQDYAKSLGKTVEQLNSAERAQAVLNVATKQMSNMGALGNAAASVDSYATATYRAKNAMEDAEEAAGKKLLPAVAELSDEMRKTAEPGGIFAGALDTIASAGSTAVGVLTTLLSTINSVAGTQGKDRIAFNVQNIESYKYNMSQVLGLYHNSEDQLNKMAAAGNKGAIVDKQRYDALKEQIKSATEENTKLGASLKSDEKAEAQKKYNDLVRESQGYASAEYNAITRNHAEYKNMSLDEAIRASRGKLNLDDARALSEALESQKKTDKEILEIEQKHGLTVKDIKIESNKPAGHKVDIKPTTKTDDGEMKKLQDEMAKYKIKINFDWKDILPTSEANHSLSELKKNIDDAITANDPVKFKAAKDALDKYTASWQTLSETASKVGEAITGVMSGASAAVAAYYTAKEKEADASLKAELQAAGVADETDKQKAQKEYDLAQKSGDKTLIAEKKKALTKAKIEEDAAKRKSEMEYKGAKMAWDFQVAQGATAIPLAILNTFAAMSRYDPIIAGAAAAAAGISAGLMEVSVLEAEPKRSSFAEGGIVQGGSYSGDRVRANVNSGEMILNANQQKQLFELANGQSSASGQSTIHNHIYLGTKEIYSEMFDASRNGDLVLHKNAITAR